LRPSPVFRVCRSQHPIPVRSSARRRHARSLARVESSARRPCVLVLFSRAVWLSGSFAQSRHFLACRRCSCSPRLSHRTRFRWRDACILRFASLTRLSSSRHDSVSPRTVNR
jgi:hypothetical protein